jgi:hypothetical protein
MKMQQQAMIAQQQMQSQQLAGQTAMQKIEMETNSKIKLKQMEVQFDMQKMQQQAQLKSQLMAEEFQYNQQLHNMEIGNLSQREKEKEAAKDKRISIQNTQQSKLIDQRKNNLPPLNFESNEDSLDGFDLAEFEPR